ncbi:MAG: D-glycero-beta-D-manno-heptose 1-phosphate adenylyltransferase [Candidatus Kapaibacterium sp.]
MQNSPFASRILDITHIRDLCEHLRKSGSRIVFTNGCFDILHLGHVEYLRQSAELGDILVVGLNSDNSVQRLKGEGRPIVPESERAALLVALRSVDYVSIFDEDTPLSLIEAVRPDVLVKGGDYDPAALDGSRYIVGSDLVRSYGGDVQVIDLVEGRSTTNIVSAVLRAYGQAAE